MRRIDASALDALQAHLPGCLFISFPEREQDSVVVRCKETTADIRRVDDQTFAYRIMRGKIKMPVATSQASSLFEAVKRVLLFVESSEILESIRHLRANAGARPANRAGNLLAIPKRAV